MHKYQGAGLAGVLNSLPKILSKIAPKKDKEERMAAVGLLLNGVQMAIVQGNLTQNDVMHGLTLILAATSVMPPNGMPEDDAQKMVSEMFGDYSLGISVYHNGSKTTHNTSDTVN